MKNIKIYCIITRIYTVGFHYYLPIAIFVFLTPLLSSCENFVDVELPKSQLTGATVFNEQATARAALNDIYAQLRDDILLTGNTRGLGFLLGLYADETDFYGDDSQQGAQFYQHSIVPSNPSIAQWWNSGYNIIYAANAVIEGLDESTEISEEFKRQFKGEALFVRAYIHLLLVELFGEIPYIQTTDYLTNGTVSRSTIEGVYELIIEDLITAASLLPNNHIGERIYPTEQAAKALLARAYQNTKRWDLAHTISTEVINSGFAELEIEPSDVFLKDATSTLWQFKVGLEGLPTLEASTYILVSAPPTLVALGTTLANTFEESDTRRDTWTGMVNNGEKTWRYAFKYKQRTNNALSTEYSIVLRLAEQYLIRAEARAYLGNLSGALEDLNKVRQRAGLPAYQTTSQNELLEAILRERRFEFFTEHGMRWFDLKRTKSASETLSRIKAGWRDTDILFPIPEAEILANPHIGPQNEGY